MSSRCASCSYPLSISDSVKCYECESYFHIDCAQLVGFPYYELSGDRDPNRNTFHCRTCELLPLPTQWCDSDLDSDLDDDIECGMPSRQLDYNLEAQGDSVKEMNEVKGSIQDLSNLCKDMLREINEIKSINLTLRCCVENLRHENEERDIVIASLKRKLEVLEGSSNTVKAETFSVLDCVNERLELKVDTDKKICQSLEVESLGNEIENLPEHTEENKIYQRSCEILIPDVKICKPREIEEHIEGWTWNGETAIEVEKEREGEESIEEEEIETGESDLGEDEVQDWEILHEEIESISKQGLEEECKRNDDNIACKHEKEIQEDEKENIVLEILDSNISDASEEEELEKVKTIGIDKHESDDIYDEETDAETESVHTLKEFGEIKNETDNQPDFSVEELEALTNEEVCELLEDETFKIKGDMKIPEDEITTEVETTTYSQPLQQDMSRDESSNKDVEKQLEENIYSTERDDSILQDYSSNMVDDLEIVKSSSEIEVKNETEATPQDIHHEDLVEVEVGEIPEEGENEESGLTEEIREQILDETTEEDYIEKTTDMLLEEGETCLEGVERLEGESRREGEEHPEEEPQSALEGEQGAEVEGEQRLGGQSQLDGEVQPSETSQTPPPHHTEEDLWDYLKEAVSGEHHPSTVEEFLQSLIGTLQQVPEEYLQPVVAANIRRANSPCSPDGDPTRFPSEVTTDTQEVVNLDGVPATGSDSSTAPVAPEVAPTVEDITSEVPPQFQEETSTPPGDGEGFSTVEAAA